jgi:2-methylisocitrate lyase-like PEP mutase family enzyme
MRGTDGMVASSAAIDAISAPLPQSLGFSSTVKSRLGSAAVRGANDQRE